MPQTEQGPTDQGPTDQARALRHLRRDRRLVPIVERFGPPVYRRYDSHFHALARSIIYQQLSGLAALSIYRRFADLFPGSHFPSPNQVLAVKAEALRAAGLSHQKTSYLFDLALKFGDGTLRPRRFHRLADEELIAELTQVKGVGVWTAQMFMMFALRRPDILPVGDLGIRKGFELLFGLSELPGAELMTELAEPWRPYRSVASWYMWRILEMEI